MGWNPWRELRERAHITLGRTKLPEKLGGGLYCGGDEPVILLDTELGRRMRSSVLAHELIHDERGACGCSPNWDYVCLKEERAVNKIVSERILPDAEVLAFVERRTELGEPTTVADLAEAFDTAEWVAAIAAERLRKRT